MKVDDKLTLLTADIDERIDNFAKKRRRDKKKAFGLKMFTVLFAAMVTILLGVEGFTQYGTWLKNIALILGASITVINAMDAFFDHRSLWIRRTVTLVRLYNLRRDLKFQVAGAEPDEIDEDTLIKFKNRFMRILQDDLREWLKLRSNREIENEVDKNQPE